MVPHSELAPRTRRDDHTQAARAHDLASTVRRQHSGAWHLGHLDPYLSDLDGWQIAADVADVAPHCGVQAEPCTLDEHLVFSRGQGREGHNFGAESVWLNVAVRPRIQHDPLELGGARHNEAVERNWWWWGCRIST